MTQSFICQKFFFEKISLFTKKQPEMTIYSQAGYGKRETEEERITNLNQIFGR